MEQAADLISTTQPDAKSAPLEPRDADKPNPVETSTPKAEEPKAEKPDIDTAIRKAFEKSTGEKAPERGEREAKPAAQKGEDEEKPAAKPTPAADAPSRERGADGKFTSKEAKEPSGTPEQAEGSEQTGEEKPRLSEGRRHHEPPARFLPRARDAWVNVPNAVKEEITRLTAEDEAANAEYRESHERWNELKPLHEQARANGTTIKQYIENTSQITRLLSTNLLQGMDVIARQYGTDLRSLAAHVMQQSGGGQPQQGQQPQPQQASRESQQMRQTIQRLEQQVAQLTQGAEQDRGQRVLADMQTRIIDPFRNEPEHARYAELEPHIAKFLNSGMIPSNLSERQKLEEAYYMADRLYPAAPFSGSSQSAAPEAKRVNPAGLKSVTGSPSPGISDTTRTAKGKEDAKDLDAVLKRSFAKGGARLGR